MTHIAFLIPTLDRIGGAEQQLILLAKGLAHRGWNVSVITLSGAGGKVAVEFAAHNIAFLSLHMRKGIADPRGWIHLRRWIIHNRPDLLHAHLPHAVLMARLARLIAPLRVLVETIHSPATGTPLRRFAFRLTARQPDLTTAVSRTAADAWLRKRLLPATQLAVIPNGIDLDHWQQRSEIRLALRHKLGLPDEFVWLSVGRLHPVKDHATLLCAFARLSSDTHLLIAGAGHLETELRRLAAQLEIQNRTHFLGFQSDVLSLVQAADAFVLTSLWEGLPMAFLEASACELPAVCTDIPAVRELFPNPPAHAIVPVGDPTALSNAMSAMMRLTAHDRRLIGRQMRQSVSEQFRLESVLDRWEDTYRALLAAAPHPARTGSVASSARASTLQLQ